MTDVTRDQYALAEANYCEIPNSQNNIRTLVCWMASEDTTAEWNPEATERGEPHSGDFNKDGVKNYPSIEEGLKGFRDTLYQENMAPILESLKANNPPAVTCSIICNSAWGSKPTSQVVADVLGDWDTYANVLVGGSDSIPVDEPTVPSEGEDDVTTPTLQAGSNGKQVANVQVILNQQAGAGLKVDGNFGGLTADAVRAWQHFWGLTEDAIVGPATWSTLINLGY